MGTCITLVILAVLVVFALRGSLKHMKGEGGCCGGGGTLKEPEKVLENPVIAKKVFRVNGMHCENCKNSIERKINEIQGASCKVSLRKKTAVVSVDREIDDKQIQEAIESLGFQAEKLQ